VGAPVYASSSPKDARYVLAHSEAVGVLCENDELRAKVAGAVPHELTFADLPALRERGRAFALEQPGALAEREASIDEDDLFTFIYTSGTTARRRLHDPPPQLLLDGAEGRRARGPDDRPGDSMLLYLPLAHNYGRLLHLSAAYIGYTLHS
jgi:Long-chain acyl-CoA synthetases (AMP-forming)